jgi:hypothetical protein
MVKSMKRFEMPDSIRSWIENGNYYEKTDGGFILYAGLFSGDGIPTTLSELLKSVYRDHGPVKVEFLTR